MSENKNRELAPVAKDRGDVVYQVAGQDVKLSYQIVRDFLTKGNGTVSDQDLTQFISICKYNQLNPFLNEAYLIKYGNSPAQMIVSKEALMKRAEANDQYSGIKGGIIVLRKNEPVELEGTFYMPGDKLVGGWAEVYRRDRDFPTIAKVRLEEYDKKQSTWNEKPSTMISKVAKVQALREAFPAQLGAMYTAEEQSIRVEDAAYEDVTDRVDNEINEKANRDPISFDKLTKVEEDKQQQEMQPEPKAEGPNKQPSKGNGKQLEF